MEENISELKKILDWLISEVDDPVLSGGALLELSQKLDALICMYMRNIN